MLIVLAGLPGTGKSTLARALAGSLGATWLRIDTIEDALARVGVAVDVHGYVVAHALAADQLATRGIVIADAVNPVAATRTAWRELGATLEIEVICSDAHKHRRRIAARAAMRWKDITARRYERHDADLVIDTAMLSTRDAVGVVLQALGEHVARAAKG